MAKLLEKSDKPPCPSSEMISNLHVQFIFSSPVFLPKNAAGPKPTQYNDKPTGKEGEKEARCRGGAR